VKLERLNLKPFAAKKPLMVTSEGRFLSLQQIAETPSLGAGSLFALNEELQIKLAVQRYSLEPDFKLGVIGGGIYSRDDIIDNIKTKTPFGQLATQAEMGYCSEFASSLGTATSPTWPKMPPKGPPIPPGWKPAGKCVRLRLKNRALFCENTTDNVTTPIATWRLANVHAAFQNRGFTVVAFTGTDDVRAKFVLAAKNALTTYTGGVGHGNYDVYTGHWGDVLLKIGQYDSTEVKGKALHFLSCRSGRDLGPDVVVVQADATFDLQMAAGTPAGQAYNATIQAFNAAIAQVPNTAAATWLTYDRDHLKLHGSAAATITPFRWIKVCFPIRRLEGEAALLDAGEPED
jgi:hypothetical protein